MMLFKKIHIFRGIGNQFLISASLDGSKNNMFLIVYPFIIEALEVMALKKCPREIPIGHNSIKKVDLAQSLGFTL